VILAKRDVVQPDIVVVSDARQISERGIEGPPLLVVEILSRSTRERDRTVKAQRYARLGIQHYWLVDPDERRVECLRAKDGVYELIVSRVRSEILTHPDWDALSLPGEMTSPSVSPRQRPPLPGGDAGFIAERSGVAEVLSASIAIASGAGAEVETPATAAMPLRSCPP